MTVHTCPRGHASETGDFCDTCGAKIGGTATVAVVAPAGGTAAPAGAADPAAAVDAPTGGPCPNCGTAQTGRERFCEDCGFDSDTGKVPFLTPAPTLPFGAAPGLPVAAAPGPLPTTPGRPPATTPDTSTRPPDASTGPLGTSGPSVAAAGVWTATVTADRAYFDANGIEGVDFPAYCPQRSFTLPAPQVRIGRRSTSKGTDPEMDLSAQPLDPGISHSHALLTVNADGVWLISDLGSTNGTYLNDEPDPLVAGRSRALADGDRVHVGAWTTITLHAPARH